VIRPRAVTGLYAALLAAEQQHEVAQRVGGNHYFECAPMGVWSIHVTHSLATTATSQDIIPYYSSAKPSSASDCDLVIAILWTPGP